MNCPTTADLRREYETRCETKAWNPRHAKHAFAEYDKYRGIWCSEIYEWLFGANSRAIYSLTGFAWTVQHARISDGGKYLNCLDWSDRKQRVYLGDGLLVYLGILCDMVKFLHMEHPEIEPETLEEKFRPIPYKAPTISAREMMKLTEIAS